MTSRLESLLCEAGDGPTKALEDEVHRQLYEFVQSFVDRRHLDDEARDAALDLVVRKRTKDERLKYQHVAFMLVVRPLDNPGAYLRTVAKHVVNEALESLNKRRGRTVRASDSGSHPAAAIVDPDSPETLALDDEARAVRLQVLRQVRAKYGNRRGFRLLEDLALGKTDHQKLTDAELRERIQRGEVDPDDLENLPKARKKARGAVDQRILRARRQLRLWLAEAESGR
jgi:DNA-directed RNA polymerase specialized sigma24 family protein